MSVLNRKMFNRGARKELRKKGGIEDVQYFQQAGAVRGPGLGSTYFSRNYNPREAPVVGQIGANIPGAQKGQTFLAPYQVGTRGGLSLNQRLLAKAAEKGIGSLGPLELGLLNTMGLQSVEAPDDLTGTTLEKGIRTVLGPVYKYGVAPAAGMSSSLAALLTGQSNLEDDSKVGGRLGSMVPDKELMESYGFQFFPTSGEELERFKRRQSNIDTNILSKEEGQKRKELALASSDAINAALAASAQSEGKSTSDDSFYDTFKGTTVEVNPTTGNVTVTEDPSKPDPISQQKIQEAVAEGPGSELDFDLGKDGEKIINEITGIGTETKKDDDKKKGEGKETSDVEPPVSRPPELVKEVFKAGNEEQKKNVVDDIIKQFTDRAPKYEGINQGLAIAKIGFAMAAGESPNALTNIAKALNDGADMLIKDKKEKDAFNRQIKLSGLQLGLTEQFKISAEERLIEREMAKEGRKPLFFVADKNLTFNGVDYEKGETVAIPTSFITENGLPKGFTTSDLAKAALDKQAALTKLINQQKKDAIIPTKTHQEYLEKISVATGDFVSANSMRNLVEANIVRNADKEITGVGPAFTQLINKAYSAAGIETDKTYENVDAFNKDMRIVSNLLLKDLLGEGSKNVSNIDRKLADEIVGLASAFGGYIFQDPDLINTRLQNVLTRIDEKERSALAIIDSVQQASLGYTDKTGQPLAYDLPKDIVTAQDIKSGAAGKAKYKLVNGIYVRA
jgi:hypothetical protein